MKNTKRLGYFFLALLTVFFFGFLKMKAQEPFACGNEAQFQSKNYTTFSTTSDDFYTHSIDPNYLASFEPITFNIFFWGINRDDGTTQRFMTKERVLTAMENLNNAYNQFNICFRLVGYDYINSSEYYEGHPMRTTNNTLGIYNYAEANNYKKPNAINIYVPYLFDGLYSGHAISNTVAGITSGALVNTKTVHEIGHCLSLRHTWSGWSGSSCEHVTRNPNDPNYNADTKGDQVIDTHAVPNFITESSDEPYKYIDESTCTYTGSGTDCQGTPYNITEDDIRNFMAYTRTNCMSVFTTGQGIRMREYIDAYKFETPPNIFEDYYGYHPFEEVIAPIFDLYTRNTVNDLGLEPDNLSGEVLWQSPDIWVRNQEDGIFNHQHQNPEYNGQDPVYVYVKVSNRSCWDYDGNGASLMLHWAKAMTGGWPCFNGEITEPVVLGGPVAQKPIGFIQAGGNKILKFEWYPPDPEDYADLSIGDGNQWHFCLLTRILSDDDPMASPEGYGNMIHKNNNVASKNLHIVDVSPSGPSGRPFPGATVGVFNPSNGPATFDLEFFPEPQEPGTPLYQEAELGVVMNTDLYNAWKNGGSKMTGMRKVSNNHPNRVQITGPSAKLENITLTGESISTLFMGVNFLTDSVTAKPSFTYHVLLSNTANGEVIGGNAYRFNKDPDRYKFQADAEEEEENGDTKMKADDINEEATYNWYDEDGNLVYSGKEMTLDENYVEKYKLEIVAADGYKDYKEMQVTDSPFRIESILPNPASDQTKVYYKIGSNASSAYLVLTNIQTGQTHSHILDVQQEYLHVNLSGYAQGNYLLSLVRNGEVVDNQQLNIN